MTKPTLDLRAKAKKHLENAAQLLESQDIYKIRYAALELRMCIEAIFYEMIITYYDSLPKKVKTAWTPKDVINEVLQCVPNADKTVTLYIGVEDQEGVEAKEMLPLGTDHRLNPKWASKAYSALGNFLHFPNIAQLENAGDHEPEKLIGKMEPIKQELEKVLSSTLFRVRMDVDTITFECKCGFKIKRHQDVLDKPVACMSCGTIYDAMSENDQFSITPKDHDFTCQYCGESSRLNERILVSGQRFKCCICNGEYAVTTTTQFMAEPLQKEKLPQESTQPET